jgi:hypothetical protein
MIDIMVGDVARRVRGDGIRVGDGDGWSRVGGWRGMMMTWHDNDARRCAWDKSACELALIAGISSSSLRSMMHGKHDKRSSAEPHGHRYVSPPLV